VATRASVNNEKQYEALEDRGVSVERAARKSDRPGYVVAGEGVATGAAAGVARGTPSSSIACS
jgi:hypothetical protein